MLKRKSNGVLVLDHEASRNFFNNLFKECETQDEIEWLSESIHGATDLVAQETLDEL